MAERLSQISLIKLKTGPEALTYFFQEVIGEMPYLTQLKLHGISLSRSEVTDEMLHALDKHKDHLELLDLQDC